MRLKSDVNTGCYSEEEIKNFTIQDCDDYLNSHTTEELNDMSHEEKTTLILELEYNFQKQLKL